MTILSLIVIYRKDGHLLPLTLDSLAMQEKQNFELILLDAVGGGAHFLRQGVPFPFQIQAAHMDPLAEVMNQGLLLASGRYLQFLFPGDQLISRETTAYLEELVEENHWPEMLYSAYLMRDPRRPPKSMTLPLNGDLLRKGISPTLSRCFWYRKDVLQKAGGFDPLFCHRPSFDFLCRLSADSGARAVYTRRVLTDTQWRRKPASEVIGYAMETCRILKRHYGLWHALKWIFVQDQVQMLRWVWSWVREAFWKS